MNNTNSNHLQGGGNTNVPQHYRITLADAIIHHQDGEITSKGLLYFYFRIKLKVGWQMKKSRKAICEELGISKTTFLKAISLLKSEQKIEFEIQDNLYLITLINQFTSNQIIDGSNQIIDESNQIIDESNQTIDGKSCKPLSGKDSSNDPNYLPNSISNSLSEEEREFFENSRRFGNSIKEETPYQSFLNGLLDQDREKFLKFAMAMVDKLPFRPTLPSAWIERNYEGIHDEYIRSKGTKDNGQWTKVSQSSLCPLSSVLCSFVMRGSLKFAKLDGLFIAEAHGDEKIEAHLKAFYRWADENDLLWNLKGGGGLC